VDNPNGGVKGEKEPEITFEDKERRGVEKVVAFKGDKCSQIELGEEKSIL